MKNFKKVLALMLALVLVLAACGGGNGNNSEKPEDPETPEKPETGDDGEGEDGEGEAMEFEGQTLKLAGLDGGYGTDGWNAVIKGFEDLTGAKVEATFEKNIEDVVRPQIQAGSGPDVLYISLDREAALTETMLKEDMVMDITDVLDMTVPGEDVKVSDKIIPGFTDTAKTNPYNDGRTFLAPLFYSPTGLWYNKAMFTEGGGKYELPTTIDEFIALGETAKADGVSLFTYPVAGYMDTFMPAMINAVGGPELYNKLMEYDVDAWANDATPVFEYAGEILKYLHPNTVSQANNESFTRNQLSVMQNETLFMPNGTWIVEEMSEAKDAEGVDPNFEWGLMPYPSVEGGDRYAYSFFEQIFVAKDTEVADLAKTFIAYLYSDDAVKAFIENGGAVQPVVGAEEYITDENQKLFYSIYSDGAVATMGGFVQAPAVEGVSMATSLYDAVNSVANGDMTVEEWQKGVVEAATALREALDNAE